MSQNSDHIFHFQRWGIRWVYLNCLSLLRIFGGDGGRWPPCSQLHSLWELFFLLPLKVTSLLQWWWGSYPNWPITHSTWWPLWTVLLEAKTPAWTPKSHSFSSTQRPFLSCVISFYFPSSVGSFQWNANIKPLKRNEVLAWISPPAMT